MIKLLYSILHKPGNSVRVQSIPLFFMIILSGTITYGQEHSLARKWMDVYLECIPEDGQGPTIHARNMFHASIAMYDAWAFYDDNAESYLLGKRVGEFESQLEKCEWPEMNMDSARDVTLSFAVFRVLQYRFSLYGSKHRVAEKLTDLFKRLGYDIGDRSVDYVSGSPSALGNFIAQEIIRFGDQDGSHEDDQYEALHYVASNPVIDPSVSGNPTIIDPNRWQPITVREYVAKKGTDRTLPAWNNLFVIAQEDFVTPEWGDVQPFALTEKDAIFYDQDGGYKVYMDPGKPPLLNKAANDVSSDQYKWGFCLVSVWSQYANPSDNTVIDISPGVLGSQPTLPDNISEYPKFYDLLSGEINNRIPHKKNPATGKKYASNKVKRSDYVRVIAEYWVDGINTYSPPGHWVTNLNHVSYHPNFERKWRGKGKELSQLEWDVKSYFTMAGAFHDAGISCWGIKGYYDYVRPISAIRYMADKGQSSDPEKPRYHPHGITLISGHIELVTETDPLIGADKENLNKIKLWSWRGPNAINDPFTDVAGVGWILAENWWPYQRYSFATPNFAGYVSGHSTFSPCGAEVLTLLTGDPYFPGGIHSFTAKKNEFLEFENGPSEDITLQWATYHDAAAETCLSRIYGGIHPPADDIPGRKIGIEIARRAIIKAEEYFGGE